MRWGFSVILLAVIALWSALPSAALDDDPNAPALYPGAQSYQEGHDRAPERGALWLVAGFGTEGGVQKFVTRDSATEVISYYARELQRYGAVTQCTAGENTEESVRIDAESWNALAKCRPEETGKNETALKAGNSHEIHFITVRQVNGQTEIVVAHARRRLRARMM